MEKIDIGNLDTINVGIVGHIDHGKTTLLEKLSGKWADTHSEELRRGITIKLGYADAILREENGKLTTDKNSKGKPIKYLTFVDAPGHEMLMATMLSGAAIMDAAILVIAANEGIKPQTREHLVALRAKGIKDIIVVQNKIDLVSKEEAVKNYEEIKNFLKGTIAENAPIIPISAQQGINIEKLLFFLKNIAPKKAAEDEEPLFLIARSFDINKPGTKVSELRGGVLGGALKRGVLKIGDKIEIKPGYSYKKHSETLYQAVKAKIISIKKGDYSVNSARPGGSLALGTDLDPCLTAADSLSGSVAGKIGSLPDITNEITVKYHLFEEVFGQEKKEKPMPIGTNEILLLSMNTSITVGTAKSVQEGKAKLSLKIPIVPLKGESIGIARNFKGHWRLIGFGELC